MERTARIWKVTREYGKERENMKNLHIFLEGFILVNVEIEAYERRKQSIGSKK
jgi:hypothetical protein